MYDYRLSYCGMMGEYCEQIYDNAGSSLALNCGNDPNYVDGTYVGTYSYFEDFMASNTVEPEPEPVDPEPEPTDPSTPDNCDLDERFNFMGANKCIDHYECRGDRTCDMNVNECKGSHNCP